MKQLFTNKATLIKNGCSFLMSLFWLSPRLILSLEHTSVRKSLFLSAFSCSDSRLSLREIDQKFKIGGIIGYGDSYLEVLFCQFKVFRLHSLLHDAAGAGTWWQKSWLMLHNSKRTNFMSAWSRDCTTLLPSSQTRSARHFQLCRRLKQMFCIVLDIELADKKVIQLLGVLIIVKIQGSFFCPPKKWKYTKRAFWCTKNLHGTVWNSGRLD